MFLILLNFSLVNIVVSHSWLDCSDYDVATQSCRGRPRNWYKRPATPFGQDVGRDIRPGKDVPQGLFCDPQKERINSPVSAGYNAGAPMAQLVRGQQVTMTWPAKNHADVGTQRGVQIFISKTPGSGDDFSHVTSKAAWVQRYPELQKTFSNCDPPGPNKDRAFCMGTFTVPSDLAPGVYTFIWWWEFNAGEFYNSCADVEVTAASGPTIPTPPSPNTSPSPAGSTTTITTTLRPCNGNGATVQSTCPSQGDDCSSDHSCCGSGKRCYHKNTYYSGCLSQCTPGMINPADPPVYQTPWSCRLMSNMQPAACNPGTSTASTNPGAVSTVTTTWSTGVSNPGTVSSMTSTPTSTASTNPGAVSTVTTTWSTGVSNPGTVSSMTSTPSSPGSGGLPSPVFAVVGKSVCVGCGNGFMVVLAFVVSTCSD